MRVVLLFLVGNDHFLMNISTPLIISLKHVIIASMKKYPQELKISEMQITRADFLKSYNQNIPATFPQASTPLLNKFREQHESLFKHGDMWSLDLHRKKLIEWLPRNCGAA